MLTPPERHAVLILTGVIAALALFHFGVVFLFPDGGAVPYANDRADGSLVTLTGTVEDITFTRTGGHLILNISGTPVFVPDGGTGLELLRGDNVTVRGIVDTYAGKKEIIVNDPADIVLH
ncbi:MAG TPA: hypothetical protein O0Y06_03495 [Methanocorpusculum sp.]|nr:hypothetical protein [Methanocorpusculum sp.]HJK79948.1 hypothetical protein [Methanocorpusculum sp.]